MNYFSHNFNYLLSLKLYTVTELAKILDVSRATIYFYKDGSIMPSIEKLVLISELYKVEIKCLITIDLEKAEYRPNIDNLIKDAKI